jgi:hypothetical protein
MKLAAVMTRVPRSQASGWLGMMFGAGLACSCGGSHEPAPATAAAVPTEDSATEANPEADAVESEPPAKPDQCAEGTCTPCGDAVCLNGFYCDEGAQACGWVPACAKEPSCECLQEALPGCSCEAREAGLFVHCG